MSHHDEKKKKKAGYKTTEFWLSLIAMIIGVLLASGAIGEDSGAGKIIAFAASALTALGYSVSRGMVKKAEVLKEAVEESEKKT